jgi:hypothetical protein
MHSSHAISPSGRWICNPQLNSNLEFEFDFIRNFRIARSLDKRLHVEGLKEVNVFSGFMRLFGRFTFKGMYSAVWTCES